MTDLAHIEALVGPLPKGREYARLTIGDKTIDWNDKADAAIAELEERIAKLEAQTHGLATAAKKGMEAVARAEKAEADLMFRTEQRDDLLKRLEQAEAEVQRLRVAEAEAMNILEGTELKLEKAEAEARKLQWMLDSLSIDHIEDLTKLGHHCTYQHLMADLAARYEEEHHD